MSVDHRTPSRTDQSDQTDQGSVHLRLSRMLLGGEPLSSIVDRLAHLSRATVPEVDEVSVTLVEDGRARTVAFTGSLASQLDERQYEQGFGPCLDAARTGRTVVIADTATEDTYGDFARLAARSGVTRVMSVGMPVPGRTIGGLNMYGLSGRDFGEPARGAAEAFAEDAAVALANALLYARSVEQVRQMREAMASRSVIEQAKGMIMAARRCSADEAFDVLRQRAGSSNRKLRVVAQEIVDGHGRGI